MLAVTFKLKTIATHSIYVYYFLKSLKETGIKHMKDADLAIYMCTKTQTMEILIPNNWNSLSKIYF